MSLLSFCTECQAQMAAQAQQMAQWQQARSQLQLTSNFLCLIDGHLWQAQMQAVQAAQAAQVAQAAQAIFCACALFVSHRTSATVNSRACAVCLPIFFMPDGSAGATSRACRRCTSCSSSSCSAAVPTGRTRPLSCCGGTS